MDFFCWVPSFIKCCKLDVSSFNEKLSLALQCNNKPNHQLLFWCGVAKTTTEASAVLIWNDQKNPSISRPSIHLIYLWCCGFWASSLAICNCSIGYLCWQLFSFNLNHLHYCAHQLLRMRKTISWQFDEQINRIFPFCLEWKVIAAAFIRQQFLAVSKYVWCGKLILPSEYGECYIR